MIYKSVTELIGNTPLIEIPQRITGLKNVKLYAKCELYNPFGSLKDRAGYEMIKDDIDEIKRSGKTVIESSSGNTAKALDVICQMYDIPFITVTNRIKTEEVGKILSICGAKIKELPGMSECPDPTDPNDPTAHIQKMISADPDKYYYPNQYTNLKNPQAHYLHTGKEIIEDLGSVDYFFATLGTTGSSRGTAECLQEHNPNLIKIGIIASKGDNIPGIRNIDEMYEVGIFDKSIYNEILSISSMEAIDGMLTLVRKCGILAGPTSGACYQRTINYLKTIDDSLDRVVNAVFIACDRAEYYTSYVEKRRPDLFKENAEAAGLFSMTEADYSFAKEVSIDEYDEFIEQNTPLIVDLRGNMAFKNVHIKDSINITDVFFDDHVSNGLPFPKDKKVLLICPTGDKSKKYSAYLNKNGLDVYSLKGGFNTYRLQNKPLAREIRRIDFDTL